MVTPKKVAYFYTMNTTRTANQSEQLAIISQRANHLERVYAEPFEELLDTAFIRLDLWRPFLSGDDIDFNRGLKRAT